MSKLKRLLGALSLVALFIFSSCVDDKVAPEVAALRQAQIDRLNQDVAYRAAETAWQEANAALKALEVSTQTALDAIMIQDEQAALDKTLAELATTLATEQTKLAKEEVSLLEAQQALAQFIATAGLQEAAYYLEQWNVAYNGGSFSGPAVATMDDTDGIIVVQGQINTKQTEIAGMKLFLNEDDSVTQAYVDATLEVALAAATAEQASRTADLATKTAERTALLANDGFGAITALEEQLLELVDDSVAALAALDAAKASLETVLKGINESNQAVVDAFEAKDTLPGSVDLGQRVNYRAALLKVENDSADLALAISDTTAWSEYADSLQLAYDDNYEPYFAEYETLLDAAIADTVETYNDLVASQPSGGLEEEVLDTYNKYIVAFRRINEQGVSQAGPATRQDTVDMVTARTAWDGLTAADLFVSGIGSAYALPLGDGNKTGTSAADTADYWTGMNPSNQWLGGRIDAPGTIDGDGNPTGGDEAVGGATAAYFNANVAGGELALHNQAKYRLTILQDQFFAGVELFRRLEAYIAAVRAGTENTGIFDPSSVPTSPQTATALVEFNNMVVTANTLGQNLLNKLKDAEDYTSSNVSDLCDQYFNEYPNEDVCGFDDSYTNYPGMIEINLATPNGTAKAAQTNYTNRVNALNGKGTTVGSLSNLTFAINLLGAADVAAYEAAKAAIAETTQAEFDTFGASIVAAQVAVNGAQSAYNAVLKAQDDIIDDIKDIYEALGNLEIDNAGSNGNQTIKFVTFESLIRDLDEEIADLEETDRNGTTGVEYSIGTGTFNTSYNKSIQWTADEIERINVKIALAAQGVIDIEADIADAERELEILQTELTVLQAIADSLQELVLAALAG